MNKGHVFPIGVYIQITVKEKDITTCALIDTGSEISIFKGFLINQWNNEVHIKIKGVTGDAEDIKRSAQQVDVILGSKIIPIKRVYEYNALECDILLGNEFLQQFQYY